MLGARTLAKPPGPALGFALRGPELRRASVIAGNESIRPANSIRSYRSLLCLRARMAPLACSAYTPLAACNHRSGSQEQAPQQRARAALHSGKDCTRTRGVGAKHTKPAYTHRCPTRRWVRRADASPTRGSAAHAAWATQQRLPSAPGGHSTSTARSNAHRGARRHSARSRQAPQGSRALRCRRARAHRRTNARRHAPTKPPVRCHRVERRGPPAPKLLAELLAARRPRYHAAYQHPAHAPPRSQERGRSGGRAPRRRRRRCRRVSR